MLQAGFTKQFKKDYKTAVKRGQKIELLDTLILALINEKTLPPKNKDHALTGNYQGYRECHIQPDWLLIYQIKKPRIVFERTGSHADLF